MQDSIRTLVGSLPSGTGLSQFATMLTAMADRMSSQTTATAGLVITATAGKKVPKIGATAFHGVANGVPVTIAAGTDMPALSGDIGAGKFAIYCFFIDSASVVTSAKGPDGATLGACRFPVFPEKKALVGYIIVTYASAFSADSTALDTATTLYVSPVGSFDPTILVG